ncbi:hypothetical protein FisN_3Hh003 [Fistulifera solaris]|uniref:Palmitoyltransferase n=1 Tax=Fistulifera solaris TaxID=1519565 RepID=A0A1Z5K0F4_FISSO|nr:hypothetical protein FisN_3Hh003 [Fistulifera solaris]|eukprot:GAX19774.1 hypothetical protein FisN_3Hh003 [Fistulifera solaris]
MEAISLTGATMVSNSPTDPLASLFEGTDNSNGVSGATSPDAWLHPAVEMTATAIAGQSNHHHHEDCCHNKPAPILWQPALHLQTSPQKLVASSSSEDILKVVWQLIRFGTFAQFKQVIDAWSQQKENEGETAPQESVHAIVRECRGPAGHTLLHWATKRFDDIQFVRFLVQTARCDNLPAADSTQMTPLHWACTLPFDQVTEMLDIFLQQFPKQIEAKDSTGCTPLLIAAQHGQVEIVAYLFYKGASLQATDHHGDSAVHWAAYKGSDTVLGLLAYFDQTRHWWTSPDNYGQMPLHLAALRGHVRTCRFILKQVADPALCLQHKDTNQRTPLELARHKEQAAVVVFLHRAQVPRHVWLRQKSVNWWASKARQWLQTFFSRHEWQIWLGLAPSDQDESPLFPYYYVMAHCFLNVMFYFSVFMPLFHTERGILWDWMGGHIVNALLMASCIYFYFRTTYTDPGKLTQRHSRVQYWRDLYGKTLESYATQPKAKRPQLCHSCHIARPPRSKHDRYTNACIEVFDHHCPFVGASVGLYNYRFFFLFCLTMMLYFVGFWIMLLTWWFRVDNPPVSTLLFGMFLGVHGGFPAGMIVYHVQLIAANLTTNEHIGTTKYDYLWQVKDGMRKYNNPWDKGFWENIHDRFFPSASSYHVDTESEMQLLMATEETV